MNTGPGHGAHGPSSLPNWWPTDPRHTSPSTSDVMSQLCRVCGEPAAGFHFGAFTCEGCKSFFGRTYNNLSSISECKNNGECVINKKNRTSCKACRLRKCLVVGMSKSGSRYGRRSNWFKIHCLLQEQQQQHHHQQHQQHQHQQRPIPQHLQTAGVGGGMGLHFSAAQQPVTGREPGRTSPPPPLPPPLWSDVKRHLRLDVDNNNSMAGDLNKDGDGSRLSVSTAAAAAAAMQAVRPELLRWPSPFFPAFPFPPPAPFFLALQPQPPSHGRPRSSVSSPASRSSSTVDDDDDDGPPSPKRIAVHRELPPVQESPMDLSVSAPVNQPPPRPSRSPSPSDGDDGDADGPGSSSPTADRSRRRKRRRRHGDVGGHRLSASDSESDSDDALTAGVTNDGARRPAKNVPLDLTFNRS